MDTWIWIAIIAGVAVIVALIAFAIMAMSQRRKSEGLQRDFGPEYDRTVDRMGDRREAEGDLQARRERVAKYALRPLSGDERRRFSEAWKETQANFVDDPSAAIGDADGLVGEAMQARGFPVADFEQNAADISVEHPYVVEHYRAAHETAEANDRGEAGTEDLRQAMVHYRSLFEELVNASGSDDMPRRGSGDGTREGERSERDQERARSRDGDAPPSRRQAGRLGQIQRRR